MLADTCSEFHQMQLEHEDVYRTDLRKSRLGKISDDLTNGEVNTLAQRAAIASNMTFDLVNETPYQQHLFFQFKKANTKQK